VLDVEEQVVDAGWLLQRVRTMGCWTQQALAGEAGVDQSAVSRIERGAQDPGFASFQALVARTGHRLEVSLRRSPELPQFPEQTWPYDVVDLALRRLMPEGLCARKDVLDGELAEGPSVAEAVYWRGQLCPVVAAACAPRRWLQGAYGAYSNERDRDLVHAVLDCGAGARQAIGALNAAIADVQPPPARRPFSRRERAERARVGALAFAHSALAVRGEAVLCAAAAEYCERSAAAAVAHERTLEVVESAQAWMEQVRAHVARENRGGSDLLERCQAEVLEAEAAEAQAADTRKRMIYRGGTPALRQVGAGGERLLMTAFAEVSQRAWALYAQMAEHPSVQRWRRDPDESPVPSTLVAGRAFSAR